MTATAATPAFGPIVTSAPRAQPQAANDRFAFAAVLELASRRGSESRLFRRWGSIADLERA